MKKVSYCIPCFNEAENIPVLYESLMALIEGMPQYDYEIIFSDNASTDGTVEILRRCASDNKKVKVILNTRNFGPARSGKNCCFNASGDVIITLASDLQTPLDLVPVLLREWEDGNLIVMGEKESSEESHRKHALRNIFYNIIEFSSDIPQYRHVTGFGAYDSSVYQQIQQNGEYDKSIKYILSDLGYPIKLVPYTQPARKHGESSYRLGQSLDFSITSLIDVSTKPIRCMTVVGGLCSVFFFFTSIVFLIAVMFSVDSRAMLMCAISFAFFGYCLCVHCIGMVGEYVLRVRRQVSKAPIVIEKERINF